MGFNKSARLLLLLVVRRQKIASLKDDDQTDRITEGWGCGEVGARRVGREYRKEREREREGDTGHYGWSGSIRGEGGRRRRRRNRASST